MDSVCAVRPKSCPVKTCPLRVFRNLQSRALPPELPTPRVRINGMRMLLDIFGQTLRTLWAHKLRSFLTMFGIAWGVGSLLLLVGLGEGFRTGNQKQMDSMGRDLMFMFPGHTPSVPGQHQEMKPYFLTYDDYLAIRSE